jgi:site-specific DNA-methyltransferase (adenine-specific)
MIDNSTKHDLTTDAPLAGMQCYVQPFSEVFNDDCIQVMKRYPDKFFDLAVVDPPYGIGVDGQKEDKRLNGSGKYHQSKWSRKKHDFKGWDNTIPNEQYWAELFRVSKNQIVWGGNYFIEYLYPSKGWIVWYKGQNDLTMSDCELAWSSFNKPTRQKELNRMALTIEGTIHPTQKPIKLYDWIFNRYASEGNLILDTHLGSGSSRISANKAGLSFVGCEIDKDYFDAQEKRFKEFVSQLRLF